MDADTQRMEGLGSAEPRVHQDSPTDHPPQVVPVACSAKPRLRTDLTPIVSCEDATTPDAALEQEQPVSIVEKKLAECTLRGSMVRVHTSMVCWC